MTTASNPHTVEHAVDAVRRHFTAAGWQVRPNEQEDTPAIVSRANRGEGRSIVESNVTAIKTSTLLLVLADRTSTPSSIWVEAGIALSSGVPGAVVAAEGVVLPFLVSAAMSPDGARLAPWRHIVSDLFHADPEQLQRIAGDIVDETLRWLAGSGD
jgi:hypothetical protein